MLNWLEGVVVWSISVLSFQILSSLWDIHMTQYAAYHMLLWCIGFIPGRSLHAPTVLCCVQFPFRGRVLCIDSYLVLVTCVRLGDGIRQSTENVFRMPPDYMVSPSCLTLTTLHVSDVRGSNLLHRRLAISSAASDRIMPNRGRSTNS